MVVRAPDVDQPVEAPTELLHHVPDVRAEIGPVAVRLADHPVLVIAPRRRAEPEGPILLEYRTCRLEALDGPRDPAVAIEGALALPDVETNAEVRQRGLDPRPHPL